MEFREVTYRNGKKASWERRVGRRAFHGKGCLFYLYSKKTKTKIKKIKKTKKIKTTGRRTQRMSGEGQVSHSKITIGVRV
jgi:hypothetical protein